MGHLTKLNELSFLSYFQDYDKFTESIEWDQLYEFLKLENPNKKSTASVVVTGVRLSDFFDLYANKYFSEDHEYIFIA